MPNAFLKVVAGVRQGLNVPLTDDAPLVIGRKRGDLVLDDPLVSSTHAQIIVRNDGFIIQDMGSTNGTLVDGRLVRESPLRPGSEVSIGNTRLVLFVGLDESQEDGELLDPPRNQATEIAWLLDEELVELKGSPDRTSVSSDVIDQDLRLPKASMLPWSAWPVLMLEKSFGSHEAMCRLDERLARYPSPTWRSPEGTPSSRFLAER